MCSRLSHSMTKPAPKQHGQVTDLAAIATTALPRAAALCTCAAHARHPSTSCLFQQQAVDVFREQKKKPRGCATGPEHGPLPPPLPCLPNVQHSCICNQEMIGENRSLHCNSFSKLALRVHNHHSAAQCKMLFSSVLLRHCTVHCKDCHVHFQDTGTFLARAFEALLRFFTGHGWRFFLTQEWTFLTTEKP